MSVPAYCKADIETLLSICRHELWGGANVGNGIGLDATKWHGVLAAALDHGLIGPLHRTARKTQSIPNPVFTSIRTAYVTQAARNFQLINSLGEILHALSGSNIEPAVLKGPAVALLACGNITHREFTDLDLLIHPEDLYQASHVLKTLGYRQVTDPAFDGTGKDMEFIRDVDQTFVELHWALNPPNTRFPLEATGIWDRMETIHLVDMQIRTLNLEDTLIALCIHASKHYWSNLKWIFDIAQILVFKATVLDWNSLLNRCETVGCTRTLLFCIQLAVLLFNVETPINAKSQILQYGSLMRLVAVVRDSLLQSDPPSESDIMRCRIEIHDRFWDRLLVAALPYPDIPRFLPTAATPITRGPLRLLTRPARLMYAYGFDWFRTVFVGR
jgi:hypothetical protein